MRSFLALFGLLFLWASPVFAGGVCTPEGVCFSLTRPLSGTELYNGDTLVIRWVTSSPNPIVVDVPPYKPVIVLEMFNSETGALRTIGGEVNNVLKITENLNDRMLFTIPQQILSDGVYCQPIVPNGLCGVNFLPGRYFVRATLYYGFPDDGRNNVIAEAESWEFTIIEPELQYQPPSDVTVVNGNEIRFKNKRKLKPGNYRLIPIK